MQLLKYSKIYVYKVCGCVVFFRDVWEPSIKCSLVLLRERGTFLSARSMDNHGLVDPSVFLGLEESSCCFDMCGIVVLGRVRENLGSLSG